MRTILTDSLVKAKCRPTTGAMLHAFRTGTQSKADFDKHVRQNLHKAEGRLFYDITQYAQHVGRALMPNDEEAEADADVEFMDVPAADGVADNLLTELIHEVEHEHYQHNHAPFAERGRRRPRDEEDADEPANIMRRRVIPKRVGEKRPRDSDIEIPRPEKIRAFNP